MLVSNSVEKPKLLMKDLFNLKRKHDSNKIDFNTQTIDRKVNDFTITIEYDNHEFNTSDELYNYITGLQKDLRDYSDERNFRETELKSLSDNILSFKLGYRTFELKVIKEV